MRLLRPCHILIYLLTSVASQLSAADPSHFDEQISPIIRQHCLRCHSPAIRKGEVSLATFADLQANDFVLPGDPEGSHLLELVTSSGDEPPAMPKDGQPLSEKEVADIREWIMQGADWPADVVIREKSKADATWWSLQPLRQPTDPRAASSQSESFATERPRSKIDEFILASLAEQGLTLSPPTDRRTLIRRATYDLLGLPPTPQEVAAFENDTDPRAYEQLIDRLLESPHYGER